MTGFARTQGQIGADSWVWEVKSVNARGLDVRIRLPSGNDVVETAARAAIAKRFKRGSINASLNVKRGAGTSSLQVNHVVLEHLISVVRDAGVTEPNIESLLAVRGVVEPVEQVPDEAHEAACRQAFSESLDVALDELGAARRSEGGRLAVVLETRLVEIEALIADAAAAADARRESAGERLAAQVAALLEATPAVPADRLAQELALIAVKSDVLEEIDRLRAHVAQARELLAMKDAVGRRLDFLCQEFNREANTLCSKSGDVAMTRAGLALKSVIDQLREQVQNVE
jgi:uncharacterized protein (TIGR00255 family)